MFSVDSVIVSVMHYVFCLSTGVPVVFIILWIGSRVYFEDTESVEPSK